LVHQRCGVDVPRGAVGDWLLSVMAHDPSRNPAAGIVHEIGVRLASLIATLRHPATAGRATGARRVYLDVWRRLDVVMLGGGLLRGAIGEGVAARATAMLAAAGVDRPVVRVAPHPEWLGLIGAGRSASTDDGRVAVMDGGHTSVKRGIALIKDRRLASVRVLAPVPVDRTSLSRLPEVVSLALSPLVDHRRQSITEVIVSVASYVHDGRPVRDNRSIYEGLDPESMQARLGIRVRLMHDGSAAWRGTDVDVPSAAIVLGTWLGVGIGPHRERLRALSEDFTILSDGVQG
jgi:hypothetical protein